MESVFPKPFCALVPNAPTIEQFCDEFGVGVPTFRFELEEGKVAAVEVLSGAACGSTDFVAEKLKEVLVKVR